MLNLILKVMWDYVSRFKCIGDVAARGASDVCVEDESSIFTYWGGGYAAQSYSSEIFLKRFNLSRRSEEL